MTNCCEVRSQGGNNLTFFDCSFAVFLPRATVADRGVRCLLPTLIFRCWTTTHNHSHGNTHAQSKAKPQQTHARTHISQPHPRAHTLEKCQAHKTTRTGLRVFAIAPPLTHTKSTFRMYTHTHPHTHPHTPPSTHPHSPLDEVEAGHAVLTSDGVHEVVEDGDADARSAR